MISKIRCYKGWFHLLTYDLGIELFMTTGITLNMWKWYVFLRNFKVNGSEIPSFLHSKTEKSLSNATFTEKDIEKVILNLDSSKAHGHDMISIRMLKIWGEFIINPLLIIYKKCLEKSCFRNEWKKANVVPVHKKSYRQLLKNYRQSF